MKAALIVLLVVAMMVIIVWAVGHDDPTPKKLMTKKDHDEELQRLKDMNAHYKKLT